MSWLLSDRTPFLLGILFSLLTWQAGEIFKEARSGHVIVYGILDHIPQHLQMFGDRTAVLEVANPSRTAAIQGFTFTLECGSSKCLTGQAESIIKAPMLPDAVSETGQDSDIAMLSGDLPPGATVWLIVETTSKFVSPDQKFRIAFTEQSAPPPIESENSGAAQTSNPVRVINRSSSEGLIVMHWFDFLYWGAVIILAAIGIWLLFAFLRSLLAWYARPKGPQPCVETAPGSGDNAVQILAEIELLVAKAKKS